jgi:hypothetical protein
MHTTASRQGYGCQAQPPRDLNARFDPPTLFATVSADLAATAQRFFGCERAAAASRGNPVKSLSEAAGSKPKTGEIADPKQAAA